MGIGQAEFSVQLAEARQARGSLGVGLALSVASSGMTVTCTGVLNEWALLSGSFQDAGFYAASYSLDCAEQ
jgi:hypothetical protein